MKTVFVLFVLFLSSVSAQEVAFLKLHSAYSTNPAEFAKKHFGKVVTMKAKITGISKTFDSTMYVISLNDGKGKIYIKPNEINENLKDRIYDLRNKEVKESDAEIKATLVKGEGSSLLFSTLASIKLIPPKKKPEKKKDDDKKKKKKKN